MSAASDYFESTGSQTPQFITQADFTQIFCSATSAMQEVAKQYLPNVMLPQAPVPEKQTEIHIPLVDRIMKTAEEYCTKEEANNALSKLQSVLNEYSVPEHLNDIFEWKALVLQGEAGDLVAIGDWLAKNGDKGFFAKPAYQTEHYQKRVPKRATEYVGFSGIGRMISPFRETETELVDAVRRVVAGYTNTTSLTITNIGLWLSSKVAPVTSQECYVIPLVSPTVLRVFWTFRQYIQTDWDVIEVVKGGVKWETAEVPLKDVALVAKLASRIASSFVDSAEKILLSKWPEAVVEMSTASNSQKKLGDTLHDSASK